jgi:hypothetical protein
MAAVSAPTPAVAVPVNADPTAVDAAAAGTARGLVGQGASPQGLGAGQNPFTAAANNVDVNKAAMLSAIANGGSAGRAVLDQANANLQAQRGNAIQAALAGSATRGVGAGLGAAAPGMQASISQAVGQPFQAGSQALGAAARDYTLTDNALQAGYGAYANEAKQAVPVMAQATQGMLNARRADAFNKLASSYQAAVDKANQANQNFNLNQSIKSLDIQTAQANRDRAQANAGGAGGKTVTITTQAANPGSPALNGFGPNNEKAVAATPAVTQTVSATPDGLRSVTGPLGYGQAVQDAVYASQQNLTLAQVQAGLLQAGYDPQLVAQVVADVKGDYTGSSATTNGPAGTTTRTSTKTTGKK